MLLAAWNTLCIADLKDLPREEREVDRTDLHARPAINRSRRTYWAPAKKEKLKKESEKTFKEISGPPLHSEAFSMDVASCSYN